jgi:hypothetical protein
LKKLLLLSLIAAMLAPMVGARADATLVGEDVAGDWGLAVDPTIAPIGAALGADLVTASIDTSSTGIVKFVIGVTQLPSPGGTPEAIRYNWSVKVNRKHIELDGKFTNYSRGICDPTAGACPPPRDPGTSPFFIRGNCAVVGSVNQCTELGIVQATFDSIAATITIPVPLSLLGVTTCTDIVPDVNTSFPDASLVSMESAFVSTNNGPVDYLSLYDEMDIPVGCGEAL